MNQQTEHEVGQGLLRMSTAQVHKQAPGNWCVEFPEVTTALGERALFRVILHDTPEAEELLVTMPGSYSLGLQEGSSEVVNHVSGPGIAQRMVRSLCAKGETAAQEAIDAMVGVDIVNVAGARPWDVAELRESGPTNPLVRLTTWTLQQVAKRLGLLFLGLEYGLQVPVLDLATWKVPVDPMAQTRVPHLRLTVDAIANSERYAWAVDLPRSDGHVTTRTLYKGDAPTAAEAYTDGMARATKWDGHVPE